MVKWLAAGVAAANFVGAIVAVRMTVAGHHEATATWLFTAGIIAACASGIVFDYTARLMEGPGLEAGRYWSQVDFGGERNPQLEAELQAKMNREGRRLLLPALIGLASVLLFVTGSILVVFR